MSTENIPNSSPEKVDKVSIRFAGDSGDGMQLTGDRFATLSAIMGNDVMTLADYPSEIRAPSGTVYGISGYQLTIGASEAYTPGDQVDVLVAMNPAALMADKSKVRLGGIIIVNEDAFNEKTNEKAGFKSNPLEDHSMDAFRLVKIELTKLTREALKETTLSFKDQDRCKNFFALGTICWLFNRDTKPTLDWISEKFKKYPDIIDANQKVLKAGYYFGENTGLFANSMQIIDDRTHTKIPGTYRYISGNKALALGLVAAGVKAEKQLFLGSYPITPATDILHELAKLKDFNILTFQAEDEIAAIGSAIGASYAGNLGVTTTSGPGLALKSEFLNLAVITELPLVVVNVQRGGPSTGLPTKMEQSDLLQALWGRNGESPLVVMAASTPSDCFEVAYEACRVAMKYMVPVVVLSDGYLANGSEPWKTTNSASLKPFISNEYKGDAGEYKPYLRNPETLARNWSYPGMRGLEHRIGGLEKQDITGAVSHDPENHDRMVNLRAEKVKKVAQEIPETEVFGAQEGVLILGWGSTYGAIRQAVINLQKQGYKVAHAHIRYLNPLPADLGRLMQQYDKILLPETNKGQLAIRIKSEYSVTIESFNKVRGVPIKISEIEEKVKSML